MIVQTYDLYPTFEMSTMTWKTFVTFVAVAFWLVGCTLSKKEDKTESFDVKPNGQIGHQTVQLENGVRCIFTYSAFGGTNEEWSINLRKLKKNKYSCTTERPEQASYLYFTNFALSILEHDVIAAEVFDNSGALLQDEEYVITEDLKSIQYKEGGFKSNLSKATVTARTPKK